MLKNDYVIVRGNNSGVFAGNLKEKKGTEVTLTNCRRLWYWDGACSISELALLGTSCPQDCKFSVEVEEALILDAVEIDLCTEEAEKNIRGVKEWKKSEEKKEF